MLKLSATVKKKDNENIDLHFNSTTAFGVYSKR